jgi:type IV pilus assembly protein PilP
MKKSAPQNFKSVCLVLLIALFWGCGNSEPSPKPSVSSHKVVHTKDAVSPAPAAAIYRIAPAAETPRSVPVPEAPSTPAPATEPPPPGVASAPDPVSDLPTASLPPSPPLPGGAIYDPTGKIDPFAPLFRDTPVAALGIGKGKREKREPVTPIEKVDLSQLKLVGIIRSPRGNKAMVEESTGKGYVITEGTYIGNNSGSVAEILRDRIVVQEEIEDIMGKITVQKRELKLPKPPGEE